MKKLRWLCFGCAVLLIIDTPWAFIDAVRSADVSRIAIVGGFAIRAGFVWLFLRYWWRSKTG
jgi:hypothetical protein